MRRLASISRLMVSTCQLYRRAFRTPRPQGEKNVGWAHRAHAGDAAVRWAGAAHPTGTATQRNRKLPHPDPLPEGEGSSMRDGKEGKNFRSLPRQGRELGYLPALARAISASTRSRAVPPVALRAFTEASRVMEAKMSSSMRMEKSCHSASESSGMSISFSMQ